MIIPEQIERAWRRASGMKLEQLVESSLERPPLELATPQEREGRRQILVATLGDSVRTQRAYERLVGGDELQPVNYLQHGAVVARSVCRLTLIDPGGRRAGYATGFLVAPDLLLTNNHVFPAASSARQSLAEFNLELDVFDQPKLPEVFSLLPEQFFQTSYDLDFSLVAVQRTSAAGASLESFGFIPLIPSPGKAVEGEWLTIIQHPGGQPKQVCVRENKLVKVADDVLWYSTDTLPGSSGSPVFNNNWQVVALHHTGVPAKKNGVMQTVDGRDFDPGRDSEDSIKWIANEGIRVSRLVECLRSAAPYEPLLEPIFQMTAERAQELLHRFAGEDEGAPAPRTGQSANAAHRSQLSAPQSPARKRTIMAPQSINVTLEISDDGRVSVRQSVGRQDESFLAEASRSAPGDRPADYDVPFDPDYGPQGARKGYRPGFLGNGFEVPLPDLGALKNEATRLLDPGGGDPFVLNYRGYSVVMHAERKLAIYSAANVDGANRFKLKRPHDTWRYDPRIPRSAQIGDYYYAGNQFDRGHLTRYEDMEFGGSVDEALQSAADSLHFTNCIPQHAKFNRSKQLWQGLEQDVLEQAIRANEFRAVVFTGPLLDPGDPTWERYKDVQYPLRFWKIAIAQTSAGKLFAAGFVLDQSDVIAQFGIEATVEVPFSAFKTYQVSITEIERLTGLVFRSGSAGKKRLSEADPLGSNAGTRREAIARARVRINEATGTSMVPPGYLLLRDESDIFHG